MYRNSCFFKLLLHLYIGEIINTDESDSTEMCEHQIEAQPTNQIK
jgi:hypothetical protein